MSERLGASHSEVVVINVLWSVVIGPIVGIVGDLKCDVAIQIDHNAATYSTAEYGIGIRWWRTEWVACRALLVAIAT